MECKKDGPEGILSSSVSKPKVERKHRAGEEGRLQLAFSTSVPYSFSTQPMHINEVCIHPTNQPGPVTNPKEVHPFMNNMDEISYWIFTKRAPCLLNYDNSINRSDDLPQCSQTAPRSNPSIEKTSPKKKRKIEILDDSLSSQKQQVFFETTQKSNDKTGKKSCRSRSQGSDIEFKLKDHTRKLKPRQKKTKTHQKKTKVITSTPKITNLRRSLRNVQQNHNHLNNSPEIFNNSMTNGNQDSAQLKLNENNNKEHILDEKNNIAVNGKFEDLSDVSGFTANYIRSTKIHSSKATPKSRNKSRTLIKETKDSNPDKLIMCINKSMNTEVSKAVLNCSTDSSQNIINLVSVKNNESSNRATKSTSLLKFMDAKGDKVTKSNKTRSGNNLNVSFQSKSSGTSRYPKRGKITNLKDNSKSELDTDQIENTDRFISKTRSGRKIGLDSDKDTGCSVLHINTSDINTSVALNVGKYTVKKRNRGTTKCTRNNRNKKLEQGDLQSDASDIKLINESHDLVKRLTRSGDRSKKTDNRQSLQRDSLRNKSGFAACFSDSDSDDEPLKHRKFFC